MDFWYGEETFCPSCKANTKQELIYEASREDVEDIIAICQECGASFCVGQRHGGQDFYY